VTAGQDRLSAILLKSPVLHPLLDRWSAIALPDAWLSGSLPAQIYWNAHFGFPSDHGLADIDLIYHDLADLSESSERVAEDRVRGSFPDVSLKIDAKNQARVHLWYMERFGRSIPPYRSIAHALSTFPTTSAVAVRPASDGLELLAPFGLDDLLSGTVRANKAQITRSIYDAKLDRWRRYWPDLSYLPWESARASGVTDAA
jgi:uncharacterized protein